MHTQYHIEDTTEIITPALVVFRELVEQNLDKMLEIAGSASRMRPHCKTHKMREVVAMQLERGITKHKCATFAEAEMLAEAGVTDILLAYNIVGPNIHRSVTFLEKYPAVHFFVTADHEKPIAELGTAMTAAGKSIEVLLDIDTGQHRTGIPVGTKAKKLYQQLVETSGLKPGGFHLYDGHQHQSSRAERTVAVNAEFQKVLAFRDELVGNYWPVPRMVCGGTASFPVYAEQADSAIEC
ncbi:MAG: alanine racemase, partial [Planctomycetes bacterium]|nr:alanine racemase [Planctomycetota bacterium]